MSDYDWDYDWGPPLSAAEKRELAEQELARLRKQGKPVAPVTIQGRAIAETFWGKSWCMNLERYSDYASRVPRGRTYVRNGSVLDLQIAKGKVAAMVSGSSLYQIEIAIAPVKAAHWKAICQDCSGAIDTVVELLQGRLAKGIMDRVCREGDGLFPSPKEIKLACDCPDRARMCKHVAAALYGVGARLDQSPELLFVLRGVDETELLANAGRELARTGTVSSAANRLDDSDVAALFGLEMIEPAAAESAAIDAPASAAPKRRRTSAKARMATVATTARPAKKTVPTKAAPPAPALKTSGRKAGPGKNKKKGAARAVSAMPR